MSLSFLFCKPWHPATTWNQKKIWEAEQKEAKQKKDEESANKELRRDADRKRYEHMAGGGGEPDPSSAALNFMYNPPPGFQQPQEEELNDDDEAVKKFKALAKMKADPNFSSATTCSELEKLVGRRKNPGVSLAEQQERFPFLKDAPVEHAYAAGVKVNFKPFNNVIRHVRCMRCGEWGHRSGDRECKVTENPNDTERRMREDPMSHMAAASGKGQEGLADATVVPPGDNSGVGDPDSAFLTSLSTKEKRRLLRRLQEMEATDEDPSERAKKRKKGHKASGKRGKGDEGKKGGSSRERKKDKRKKSSSAGKDDGGADKRRRREETSSPTVGSGGTAKRSRKDEEESEGRKSKKGRVRREDEERREGGRSRSGRKHSRQEGKDRHNRKSTTGGSRGAER